MARAGSGTPCALTLHALQVHSSVRAPVQPASHPVRARSGRASERTFLQGLADIRCGDHPARKSQEADGIHEREVDARPPATSSCKSVILGCWERRVVRSRRGLSGSRPLGGRHEGSNDRCGGDSGRRLTESTVRSSLPRRSTGPSMACPASGQDRDRSQLRALDRPPLPPRAPLRPPAPRHLHRVPDVDRRRETSQARERSCGPKKPPLRQHWRRGTHRGRAG